MRWKPGVRGGSGDASGDRKESEALELLSEE